MGKIRKHEASTFIASGRNKKINQANRFMKKSETKISVKLGDILDSNRANAWDYLCGKYGLNM